MDEYNVEKFLLLATADRLTRRKITELWDEHSGLPGLLDASIDDNYQPYYYLYGNQSYYRRNGRRIPDRQLRAAVEKVSTAQKSEMRKTTQQLIAGTIIASVWYLRMMDLMAVLYKTLWTLSIGGFLFDNDILRNAFYLFSLGQFHWLDNFHAQILNKSQPLNGSAMTRAGLYGEYGNSYYQNALTQQKERSGYKEARRILGYNEEHCKRTHKRPGCVDLALLGWVPIQQLVPLGNATCYSNCHCHVEYR